MHKTRMTACLFAAWLICAQPLFGQDVYFTNRAETLYRRHLSAWVPIAELDEGTIIDKVANARFTSDWVSGASVIVFRVEVQMESGLTGWLSADAVSIRDSVALPERITENRWTHSYYLDVLRSGDRERLFEFEPFWRDHFEGIVISNFIAQWYDVATTRNDARFHNIFVVMNELSSNDYWFINRRIEEEGGVYFIDAICVRKIVYAEPYHFGRYFSEGETVRFSLQLDGDFLDVFVDGTKIFTLIKQCDETERQFASLMGRRYAPVDLSRIVWPRRADGTMDFPPPGIDMSGFETSHTTTARLRVRDNPATDSLIVTTLGAEVQVLETGPAATIGDVTAPWVRLLAANGFTGWAFSGFLEPIAVAVEPEAAAPTEASVSAAEIPGERLVPAVSAYEAQVRGAGLLAPWLAAGGAALLLAGIAAVAAMRRKARAQMGGD